ncbi:phage tail tape measure protein [Pseudomonas chlororaphis]|uniref:phage tail tape measure protein n=1 Tax=Pseudomonas chlororaphis TaxID=587753 RepID=UPI000F5767C1|nr:phage tail tape measure protein [Pseudomonas chlororaphis]AZC55439.1 Phage tail length tape-measure protein [Pseudomonas chlororaphis subsp. piscium]
MADKFQLKALITGVDKLSPKLAGIRKNVAGFKKGLDKTGLGKINFGEVVAGGALAAPFVAGVRAAIDYESQMADVKKVVNFDTSDQFRQMGDDIGRMSERLPMAAGDIAKIVAAGGQSGIAREELLGFAEAAVKMGIAFDQTAEESGDMMAKWRTSFKMTQVDVIGLADKINYLGNTGPANTRQISDIVTRIGPLGEIAGLASGQIAALGATMAGVGIEQEVAATGIKNFMLAMTKGSSATKAQAQAFKSLRLDSKAVAKSMQKDAQGTVLDILDRISTVDKDKQAGLMGQLFGTESITAIAPLLTNLGLLKSNLQKVADQKKYSGSMDAEYASRAATTANNLQLMRNAAASVARAIGDALLPAVNLVATAFRPMISRVASLVEATPALVRGLAAAGIAFTAIRVAALAATVAVRLAGIAFAATPIGIIAVAIAAAAGLIIANWTALEPFFSALWRNVQAPLMVAWGWFKSFVMWTPIGSIVENWGPITEFFAALWDLLRALSVPVVDFLRTMFDWSPMGLIVQHWGPITAWFQDLWATLKPIIEPIMEWFGGGDGGQGLIKTATQQVGAFTEAQRKRNAGEGGGDGSWLNAGYVEDDQRYRRAMRNAMNIPKTEQLLSRPNLAGESSTLLQQSASAGAQKLNGELKINIAGAPPGTTVEQPKTNQPGLNIKPSVGTRTIGVMRPGQ